MVFTTFPLNVDELVSPIRFRNREKFKEVIQGFAFERTLELDLEGCFKKGKRVKKKKGKL